ncbi:MAG: autotransporter outer membrane beta-barrel domain-containing protein, partial [Gammaproteobacteria bacterium]|nr:autotransporter outer membrane beta-barrel domain-containing protein [Gammaproteobacteria bacterium]
LGLDAWINGRWLVGVAASRTQVDADYRLDDGDGALDVTLTSVHPYVRFAPDGRRELWAILGAGTGEVENTRAGAPERESTDVQLYMAAAGVRQALEPLASGVAIALLGDAGFGRLNGDAGSGLQTLNNLAVDTWRARAGAEVSYTMARDGGTSITPFAEIAGRVDGGGEDDTKAGVEVSAGVAYADPASGFGLEARGRTLVLYSGGDYREYGASLTASLSPGAGGEGLSLALSPRLGIDPGRIDVLWREDPFRALNPDRPKQALSLDAEIGYGISVASGRGLATPFGELRVGNGESRRARAGIRFGMPGLANRVDLEFAGARQEDRINAPEHRVELIGRARF